MLCRHHSTKARIFPVGREGHENMKHTIVMIIEDGNLQKVEACAFSKNSANIYIYAGSFLQAQNLLQQGKELATQAVQNWKPEDTQNEAPALDPKQFYVNKLYKLTNPLKIHL